MNQTNGRSAIQLLHTSNIIAISSPPSTSISIHHPPGAPCKSARSSQLAHQGRATSAQDRPIVKRPTDERQHHDRTPTVTRIGATTATAHHCDDALAAGSARAQHERQREHLPRSDTFAAAHLPRHRERVRGRRDGRAGTAGAARTGRGASARAGKRVGEKTGVEKRIRSDDRAQGLGGQQGRGSGRVGRAFLLQHSEHQSSGHNSDHDEPDQPTARSCFYH